MNFYENDQLLKDLLRENLESDFYLWADQQLRQYGDLCGTVIDERAEHTDREGQPRLIKYDRFGNDQSYVWLNEGYKQTVKDTYGRGIVGYLYKDILELKRKGNYFYSFAQGYLLSQSEPGFYCPVTLTMATALLIDRYADEELKKKYLPPVASTGDVELYEGATFLTERQGGSDVGANETEATYENGSYKLYGEKYFASNAGACGVATVLARTEGAEKGTRGLSLFLVPWRKDDGSLNGVSIRRLKDKLGVRAVPSAEVVLDGAEAFMIGKRELGFYYMMEALNLSRICNAVASLGIMRRAYAESFQYASERKAFGEDLLQYPMVQDSLVKMAVKLEAEMVTVFELISLYDDWVLGEKDKEAVIRLLIALLKSESADQAIHFCHEAIEMHGGNGYIEDFVTPRLLRDAQVLTVWEGTANILGLEVLRLFDKYQMDEIFIQLMREKLEEKRVGKTEWTNIAKDCLEKLAIELHDLKDLQSGEKTRRIKLIQKKMTTLLESVMLLERAHKKESDREQAVAKIYIIDQLLPLWGQVKETWSLEEGRSVIL